MMTVDMIAAFANNAAHHLPPALRRPCVGVRERPQKPRTLQRSDALQLAQGVVVEAVLAPPQRQAAAVRRVVVGGGSGGGAGGGISALLLRRPRRRVRPPKAAPPALEPPLNRALPRAPRRGVPLSPLHGVQPKRHVSAPVASPLSPSSV